ncbi:MULTISPECIES: hypothetical protein [Arsenicicoccus]|uniref:hypothetical protein n=1 Tax=Arsenicicoccus TaxID=267408 RepID=UPI00257F0D6E|nr:MULTISPECIES: hypothetical protein [Arsenicicoccus]
MTQAPSARYGRNPGWGVTAVLAIVYGMLVAFGDLLHDDRVFWDAFTIWAGLPVLAVFVICMVIPFIRWLTSSRQTYRR